MKTAINNGLKKIVTTFAILLTALLFLTPVEAEETLNTITELPQKELTASTQEVGSDKQSKDIVVLYKQPQENNIGDLNLNKNDFNSGSSLNGQVDVLEVKDENQTEQVLDNIKNNDNVLAASEDSYVHVLANPNDHYYSYQSYLDQVGYGTSWTKSGNNPVKIAIFDTGVLTSHEDLANRFENTGRDYTGEGLADLNGHGTHVASVAAAQANNAIGMAGAAGTGNVKVVNYKIGFEDGSAKISSIAQAITDIVNTRKDIKIINISLGAHESPEVELAALKLAEDNGIVIVAASGNSNENTVMYPAKYPTVIAAGAVNRNNQRCTPTDWGSGNGSNYGDGLNIVAPGNEIVGASYDSTNGYGLRSGTSFSAPIVSGACALILTHNPNLTPAQVRDIIYSTAQDLGPAGVDPEYGYGILRLDKAIERVNQAPVEERITLENSSLQVAIGGTVQVKATSTSGSGLQYTSSNPAVATVDANGTVKGVSAGNCTITVSLANNPSVTANCSISVTANAQPSADGYQNVYRLYNKVTGEHLFTTDTNEANQLASTPDWDNEGTKWESPTNGQPVYRLYSLGTHNHLYTTDQNEVSSLVGTGSWTIDNGSNPLFYSGGNTNIYRLYNETLKMHLLTTDQNEYNELPNHGWQQEGAKLLCR